MEREMAGLNLSPKKMSNAKLKLSELNPHLMCVLCGGYYIDATTIVECLHSFCRSCIVKHLERSKYCPICEVQVHKTKPLINIRPDKTLQDIVYKLVPGLFANEMRNRRRFYRERPHYIKPNDVESSGEVVGERKIYVNDENITFSLVYHEGGGPTVSDDSYQECPPPARNEKRYFKCPTGVCVNHLKKLLRAKYELSDSNYKLEIYFKDQELHDDFTLLDVAYIYLWKTKGSLDMTFKIFENVVKRQKIEETTDEAIAETLKQSDASLPNPESMTTAKEVVEEEDEEEEKRKKKKKEEEKQTEEPKVPVTKPVPEPASLDTGEKNKKPETRVAEPAKENGLNEVQLQISESGVMSVSKVENSEIVKTVEEAKVRNSVGGAAAAAAECPKGNGEVKPKAEDKKPATPYKSIRASPKTWNPVIPKEKLRPTLMKNSEEPKKPCKFFKMRNVPRFLGNPSSGVKPMYAGSSPEKPEERKSEKSLSKILKIDPKTLRPIEKGEMKMTSAPSAPNLLTNPFIPNNNHFLFSDVQLLPPSAGNYSPKEKASATGRFKPSVPNGTYPPVCFPSPEHTPPGFYPFGNLTKPQSFPFPVGDKMDPLLRASRLSPFGNLTGFNMAGFHASLPPSISRLLNPHHHFRKTSQCLERKGKEEESTKETKSCDDSQRVKKDGEEEEEEEKKKKKKEEKEVEEKVNGETGESALKGETKSDGSASSTGENKDTENVEVKSKETDKDKTKEEDKDKDKDR